VAAKTTSASSASQPTCTAHSNGETTMSDRLGKFLALYKFPGEEVRPFLAALATAHVTRFSSMIKVGNEGAQHVRVEECKDYLALWQIVRGRNGKTATFSPAEINEVMKAILSSNYDETIRAWGGTVPEQVVEDETKTGDAETDPS
jgi:hypothetical protein